jgi:hypothetical protein
MCSSTIKHTDHAQAWKARFITQMGRSCIMIPEQGNIGIRAQIFTWKGMMLLDYNRVFLIEFRLDFG